MNEHQLIKTIDLYRNYNYSCTCGQFEFVITRESNLYSKVAGNKNLEASFNAHKEKGLISKVNKNEHSS